MNDMYQCKQFFVENRFLRSQTELDNCYTQLRDSCTRGFKNWLEDEYRYVRKELLTKRFTATSAIPGICDDGYRLRVESN
jgi:hypothetical protein